MFEPKKRLAAMNALLNIKLNVYTKSPPVVELYRRDPKPSFKSSELKLDDSGPSALNEAVAALGGMFVHATEEGFVAWHEAGRDYSPARLEVVRSKARHIQSLVNEAATGSVDHKALVLGFAVFLVREADGMDTSNGCP